METANDSDQPQPLAWVCKGSLRVTDPAYGKSPPECPVAQCVLPAAVGRWLGSVAPGRELVAWAGDTRAPDALTQWADAPCAVWVDSRQCGVFDEASYPADTGEYDDGSSVFGQACAAACGAGFGTVRGEPDAGTVRGGTDVLGVVGLTRLAEGFVRVRVRGPSGGPADAVWVSLAPSQPE